MQTRKELEEEFREIIKKVKEYYSDETNCYEGYVQIHVDDDNYVTVYPKLVDSGNELIEVWRF